MRFTAKQLRFIDEYLIESNGKQAAIRAGYAPGSAEVTASKLLRSAKVQEALAEARKKLPAKTEISREWVLEELRRLASADIRKLVRWCSNVLSKIEDKDGKVHLAHVSDVELVASAEIDDATAAAIKEVSLTSGGALKIKLYDKRQALVDLMRYLDRRPAKPPAGKAKEAAAAVPAVTDDWAEELGEAVTKQ